MTKTTADPRQTLAQGFAQGKISLEDFTAGIAVLDGVPDQASSTGQSNRAAVRVELSDDYQYGHISILKLTPSGSVKRRFNLWASDAEAVAQGILDAMDQLPDEVS